MKRVLVVACLVAAFAFQGALIAVTEATAEPECSWGASSMAVEIAPDGTVVESEPVTSGCLP